VQNCAKIKVRQEQMCVKGLTDSTDSEITSTSTSNAAAADATSHHWL